MIAAIIAGGSGTRIRDVSGELIPKALLPVAGEPIVFRQLSLLSRYGINRVIFIAGYLSHILREKVMASPFAKTMQIDFVIEEKPRGTAGGLLAARPFFEEKDFLTMYGDISVEMDLKRFMEFHKKASAAATLVAHPNDHPQNSDLLRVDDTGKILEILPHKNRQAGNFRNLVPAAVYALSREVFGFIDPTEPQDFIREIFPKMIGRGKTIQAYCTPEYLRDMGSPDRYDLVARDISSGLLSRMNWSNPRPVIFFDLDGVLNEDIPGKGITSPAELKLLPRAAEAVKAANQAGVLTVAVTNRPQMAKGFISLSDLESIHGRLEMELGAGGAWLDRIFYCPHHPEKGHAGEVPGLKINCDCRKPKTGLLKRALAELPLDLERSCLIGDSKRDIEAARAMKIPAYGVRTGNGCRDAEPDKLFNDVYEAVHFAIFTGPLNKK